MNSLRTTLLNLALFAFVALFAASLFGCTTEETSNGYRKKAWAFEYTADKAIQPAANSAFKKADPKKAAPAAPAK